MFLTPSQTFGRIQGPSSAIAPMSSARTILRYRPANPSHMLQSNRGMLRWSVLDRRVERNRPRLCHRRRRVDGWPVATSCFMEERVDVRDGGQAVIGNGKSDKLYG